MHNPLTATHDPVERDITVPPAISACDPGPARFTPLFTRTVRLALTTVTDELGGRCSGCSCPTASCSSA